MNYKLCIQIADIKWFKYKQQAVGIRQAVYFITLKAYLFFAYCLKPIA